MTGFWRRLVAKWPFLSAKPRVVALAVPSFVLAAVIGVLIGLVFYAGVAWVESDHGQKLREVLDSLLPLFRWRSDLGQFLVQATLGLVAAAIIALVFILLYNSLLSILGEEED